ncbi:hypothetical protein OB905_09985 [Halobacteria archaeon AArc-dxtr1]|nr:hypothetical protein [Halobacteria archaeon AArc-dxtr1]
MTEPARWESLFDRGATYNVDREAVIAAHERERSSTTERGDAETGPNIDDSQETTMNAGEVDPQEDDDA